MTQRAKIAVAAQHVAPEDAAEPVVRAIQELQELHRVMVGHLNDTPGALGRLVTLTFAGTDTQETGDHGLMRTPVRWTIEDVTDGYGLFERVSWTDRQITIQSSGPCTLVVRVE